MSKLIPAKYFAENNKILPEVVEGTPTSADVLPGKIYIDTTNKAIDIVVAVGDDNALTTVELASYAT